MRPSRPSTSARRRGFTLLEVVIAASLLAVVIGITLAQMGETSTATNQVTAQADLRRIGNEVLERIAHDLRTTQSRYVTIETANTTALPKARIQFRKITGFDATAGDVTLESSSAGVPLVREYKEVVSPAGFRVRNLDEYGSLEYRVGTAANLSTMTGTVLTFELAKNGDRPGGPGTPTITSGFMVSTSSHSSLTSLTTPLGTTSGTNCFPDQPVAVSLKVVMKRRIGAKNATGGDLYTFATCQTTIELKPSKNY